MQSHFCPQPAYAIMASQFMQTMNAASQTTSRNVPAVAATDLLLGSDVAMVPPPGRPTPKLEYGGLSPRYAKKILDKPYAPRHHEEYGFPNSVGLQAV
jgi:hypothetical protein